VIDRPFFKQQIRDSLAEFRVTALLGPRQRGKTTLAREFVADPESFFDLEDPLDLARLEAPFNLYRVPCRGCSRPKWVVGTRMARLSSRKQLGEAAFPVRVYGRLVRHYPHYAALPRFCPG